MVSAGLPRLLHNDVIRGYSRYYADIPAISLPPHLAFGKPDQVFVMPLFVVAYGGCDLLMIFDHCRIREHDIVPRSLP